MNKIKRVKRCPAPTTRLGLFGGAHQLVVMLACAVFALSVGVMPARALDANGAFGAAKGYVNSLSPVSTLCASATPVTIYGQTGAGQITVASCTIKANTLKPGSVLDFRALFKFATPNNAGRSVYVYIGSTAVWQSFPTASLGAISTRGEAYISPDLQTLTVFTQNMNDVLSPTNGQGAPYTAHTSVPTALSIDFTQDQTVTVQMKPINNDVAELDGWALSATAPSSVTNYAPSTATATFSNSLGAGTGSLGSFILTTTGNTTSGSNAIASVGSVTGVLNGQVITGSCLPAGGAKVIASSAGSLTLDQNATGTATGCALTIFAGAWPQQELYLSPGRPVFNNSVGGTTSAQISTRQALDKVRGVYWTQLWGDVCRNDVGTGGFQANCIANLQAMASRLNGAKYAFSTTIPAANEAVNSANWNAIVATNAAMVSTFGGGHIVDTFATLTANGTVNIPLKYRKSVNTTGTCSASSTTLTVASGTNISNGMYVISPGSTVISDGSTASAPTVVSGGGTTTLTLSAACGAGGLSSAMVSFVDTTEVHLNDFGYYTGYTIPYLNWLTANGA